MSYNYDLIVIGSGPGGQSAAVHAAQMGKRVALIERKPYLGGVSLQTGTIPSKALREAAFLNTRNAQLGMRGALPHNPAGAHLLADAMGEKDQVIRNKESQILESLMRHGITLISGEASFVDEHTLSVRHQSSDTRYTAKVIILATGSRPRRPNDIPFDKQRILDSSSVLKLRKRPDSMIVVGGGVIACEFASIFAALGTRITLVDSHTQLMAYMDDDIIQVLQDEFSLLNIELKMNTRVKQVEKSDDRVSLTTEENETLQADTLLYALGREPNYAYLKLSNAGLHADDNGWVQINDVFQTSQSSIYIIGDLAGRPSLASTAMEQGRIAAQHAFSGKSLQQSGPLPMAIYTIPEVSYVGETEAELKQRNASYVCGIAHYKNTARGQIIGNHYGLLKLLVDRESRQILGVHIIGESASELVHVGQMAMTCKANIEVIAQTVFNYPTLAQCYKTAALKCIEALN